jgi:hypothetical protein
MISSRVKMLFCSKAKQVKIFNYKIVISGRRSDDEGFRISLRRHRQQRGGRRAMRQACRKSH